MIRPECANCVADDSGAGETSSVNMGVVLGVLGGLALTALLVLVVVPVVRRQIWRQRRVGGRGDVESGFFPSRRSSSRHQKMQQQQLKVSAGPDVLLPLIDPVSTIAWSDLRSSDPSVDSLDRVRCSFHTDDAALSHTGLDSTPDMGQHTVDAQMSPDAVKLSPTPPGLPSKIGASTATPAPSYSSTPADSTDALHAGMYPLSPVSPVFTMSQSASRPRPGTARYGMEPVIEDGSGSGPPPQLRQLPSPPSSPDQYEPNYRSGVSRRRPSVTASLTAPSALPTRPRSSTTTAVPLSAAFQTSRLSGTQPHVLTTAHARHRYPSLAVPAPRSRASSVSLEPIPDLSPAERPTDAIRRMSTTELRHRHPSSAAATQGSHGTRPSTLSPTATQGSHSATHGSHGATQGSHSGDQPRAFLRQAEAERIPEYGEPGPSSWQRRSMQPERSPPLFTSSPSPLSPPPSARSLRPLPIPGAQGSSRPASEMRALPLPQLQQHLPPLVKKRDSPALRPLPASPFVQAGSTSALSRQPSAVSTRTRSSSVMSERSLPRQLPPLAPLPPLEFGSDFSPHGDSRSVSSRGKST